jgi:BirA family biotin operon repressor/biotin-[acetyl-CoA-carboxylase] ligase
MRMASNMTSPLSPRVIRRLVADREQISGAVREGVNLLFSILVHPVNVPITSQFLLSMAEALSLYDVLTDYTEGISLKWPNDVYWHDKKISGTLIETAIAGGRLKNVIFGSGININQRSFDASLPNPVSLFQILGHETSTDEVFG